jgi:hypothetical protein
MIRCTCHFVEPGLKRVKQAFFFVFSVYVPKNILRSTIASRFERSVFLRVGAPFYDFRFTVSRLVKRLIIHGVFRGLHCAEIGVSPRDLARQRSLMS